jgi:hypothetical protein
MGKIQGVGENTLKKVTDLDQQLREAQRGKNPAREAAFKDFGRSREYYSRLIGSISAVIPREIQIDRFAFTETTPSSAATTGGMAPGGMRPGMPGMSGMPGMPGMPGGRAPLPGGAAPGASGATGAAGARGPAGAAATATIPPEETLVSQSSIQLSFTATCDAERQPEWLKSHLPEELAKAVIYPEKIGAIKTDKDGHLAIVVGAVSLAQETETRTAMSSPAGPAMSGVRGVPGPGMGGFMGVRGQGLGGITGAPASAAGGSAGAPATVIIKSKESATVMIGLVSAKEADALLAALKEKKEAPAAEGPSAATTARPAAPVAPPGVPPGPGPTR